MSWFKVIKGNRLPRKAMDKDAFKQSIKEVADDISINTIINFTNFGTHDKKAEEFLHKAKLIYAKLTGDHRANTTHANKVFNPRSFSGNVRMLKRVLLDNGWESQHYKFSIFKKVK
tara:strand:+ start:275 stop:622 length:348 start_codon:yes stop_codon:yes gene_type:complete